MTERKREYAFISYLEKLRDAKDRAALARLRRGLGKKMGTPEMFPYVVPFLPKGRQQQERYFLIAALFAMHPEPAPAGVTMGSVFNRMWGGQKSMERRFANLLSADSEDIGDNLRRAVSLAKSKGQSVDYHQLLYDLSYWDHPDRFIQLAWARDFWRNVNQERIAIETKGALS